MSTTIGKRIRELRESLSMGRQAFCDETGIPKNTLVGIEQERNDPSYKAIKAILDKWPEYTLWLMQNMTNVKAGQISPDIEEKRRSQAR